MMVGFAAAPKPVNVEEEVVADDPCAETALQVRTVDSSSDDSADDDAGDETDAVETDDANDDDADDDDADDDDADDDEDSDDDSDVPATAVSPDPAAADCGESFDGPPVSNIKGTYQARIVVLNGEVIDVLALEAGTSAPESIAVNSMAIPAFKERVLAAQTWDVEAVSGASYTSPAFLESLEGAFGAAGLD